MDRAADDGLDPAAYPTPDLAAEHPDDAGSWRRPTWSSAARSRASSPTSRPAGSGRRTSARSSRWSPSARISAEALSRLSQSADVAADIASFEPPHPEYLALKTALAKLRAMPRDEEPIVIPRRRDC